MTLTLHPRRSQLPSSGRRGLLGWCCWVHLNVWWRKSGNPRSELRSLSKVQPLAMLRCRTVRLGFCLFFSVIVYSEVWYLLLFYCVFYLLSWVLHELLAVTRDGCSGQFSCVRNILWIAINIWNNACWMYFNYWLLSRCYVCVCVSVCAWERHVV